jgi:hypothetical protein
MKKLLLSGITMMVLLSCSHKKNSIGEKESSSASSGGWDYDRVRQVREAEKSATPALPSTQDESDCQMLTRAQMVRANASGCRPVDNRTGQGEDMFCCPRS